MNNYFLIFQVSKKVFPHGDLDHTGNAIALLKEIKIQYILLNQGNFNSQEQEIISRFQKKIIPNYEGKNLMFHKLSQKEKQTENQNSTVIHLCLYSTCTLFMGDAQTDTELELLEKYQIQASVLKVGHHGSKTSTTKELLNQVPFQISIISAGRNNRYHHPNETVITRLKENNITIYNTQTDGTIALKIKKKGFTILTNPP